MKLNTTILLSYFWAFFIALQQFVLKARVSEGPVTEWRLRLTDAYSSLHSPFRLFILWGLFCMKAFINLLYKWYVICQASICNKRWSHAGLNWPDCYARMCFLTVIIMKTHLFVCFTTSYLNVLTALKTMKLANWFLSRAKHHILCRCFLQWVVGQYSIGQKNVGWFSNLSEL